MLAQQARLEAKKPRTEQDIDKQNPEPAEPQPTLLSVTSQVYPITSRPRSSCIVPVFQPARIHLLGDSLGQQVSDTVPSNLQQPLTEQQHRLEHAWCMHESHKNGT